MFDLKFHKAVKAWLDLFTAENEPAHFMTRKEAIQKKRKGWSRVGRDEPMLSFNESPIANYVAYEYMPYFNLTTRLPSKLATQNSNNHCFFNCDDPYLTRLM